MSCMEITRKILKLEKKKNTQQTSYLENEKQNYHTFGTFSTFNGKIEETEAKSIPLSHMYMTSLFPDVLRTLQ